MKYKIGDICFYPRPIQAFLSFAGNSQESDSSLRCPLLVGAYTLCKVEIIKVNNEYTSYDCKLSLHDRITYCQGVSAISEHVLFDNIDDYIHYCNKKEC